MSSSQNIDRTDNGLAVLLRSYRNGEKRRIMYLFADHLPRYRLVLLPSARASSKAVSKNLHWSNPFSWYGPQLLHRTNFEPHCRLKPSPIDPLYSSKVYALVPLSWAYNHDKIFSWFLRVLALTIVRFVLKFTNIVLTVVLQMAMASSTIWMRKPFNITLSIAPMTTFK